MVGLVRSFMGSRGMSKQVGEARSRDRYFETKRGWRNQLGRNMALLKGSTDLMIPTISNMAIKGNRYHQQGVWWQ